MLTCLDPRVDPAHVLGLGLGDAMVVRNVRGPIQTDPNYLLVAVGINAVFVLVGALLFLVGLSMAIRLFRSYSSSVAEARAPVAADGGTPKG